MARAPAGEMIAAGRGGPDALFRATPWRFGGTRQRSGPNTGTAMTYKLLIDGRLVDGARTIDVIDPALGEPFATCACADEAQLDAAVAAAKRAFPEWSRRPADERAMLVRELASRCEAKIDDLARLMTREQGKPLPQSVGEIAAGIHSMRYLADLDLTPVVIRDDANERIIEHRTPLGVVAAITPWNFPFGTLALKIPSALLAGNTVVAKPAATTPLVALALAELAADLLPPGVLNVIVDANDLGGRLTRHPDVAKIAFTGSTATGKKVAESGVETLKRVTLELGGNDPAIILDDIDVKTAARKVFDAAMFNCGQVCVAAKRIYAPRAMYDALCDELAKIALATVVDNGLNQGTEIGPLQNRQQYDKVLALIEDSRAQGRIVAGGAALDRPGYFIAPTIVRDLPDSARLVREEQFGPVMPILAYDDIEDAIARANDSEFGLAGTVWTSDPRRGEQVAMRIDSGTVWVNKYLDLPEDVPFGGVKQSGLGREKGLEGLHEYMQVKVVNIAKASPAAGS
jgi:acyl-CoA reductase-like NAD-dependent aldehyde dehydrogenase